MSTIVKGGQHRKPEHHVDALFIDRWSPRAMSGESIAVGELMSLFEAAHWAPSSYNGQPWRFLLAHRDTQFFPVFLGLLVEANQAWCKNASALVVVVSRKNFEHNGKPAITHSYDTGAAAQNLTLQGWIQGLVVHSMQGFDYDKARSDLHVPDDHSVEAMIAIGRPGDPGQLPEALAGRETPSPRKPISDVVFEGPFPGSA